MKKLTAILLTLCCISALFCALADANRFCDEMPQDLRELAAQDNSDGVYMDCLLIKDTPKGDMCLVLSPWSLVGYTFKDGVWTQEMYVTTVWQGGASKLYFCRHEAGAASGKSGAAGLCYPDALGFDVVFGESDNLDECDVMHYHWLGESFALVGWQKAAADVLAIRQDDCWAFFDKQTGKAIGDARIDALSVNGYMAEFDNLPNTYAEAKAMEAVSRASAESLFDGWTLAYYQAYADGRKASASYYRIIGNMLTIRRVALASDAGGVISQRDTMPVPLSVELLTRLASEPFDTLINTSVWSETFLAENALDASAMPITGTVLQSNLQSHGLLLLARDENGERFLVWITQNANGGYTFQASGALPSDAHLDLFHAGEGSIGLEWNAQSMQCGAVLAADGTWQLSWVMSSEASYSVSYCGVDEEAGYPSIDMTAVGTHPWHDLFRMDVTSLPATSPASQLDRTGWAVVNNPDPADRLHLRAKPDRAAESRGKFYNRTPVQVLSRQGDWSQVAIGTDGRLEGWMLTKFLAFGKDMDGVACASPIRDLREEHLSCELFASPDGKETTGVAYALGREKWIAGVIGDDWYILLDAEGNTGYLPQSWMWEGNG